MLGEFAPHVEAVCITPATGYIADTYDLHTIKLHQPRPLPASMVAAPGRERTLLRPFSEAKRWIDTYRAVRPLSLVFVPGTGVLDDFGLRPQGVPYILFRWALCSRLARTPFAFVGIGAGPIKYPRSHRLMVWAARLATHRSYRDVASQTYMAELGGLCCVGRSRGAGTVA
jgi:polysaccharide pyruvyl transferase WcaK-like protein